MREPYITVRAVQPLVAALDARGFSGRDLLLASGIDPALLDDVDGTLPQRAVDDQMKKPARGGLSAST